MQETESAVYEIDYGAGCVGGRRNHSPLREIHDQVKGELNQNPPQTVLQDISAAVQDFQPGRKGRFQTAGHDMEEKRCCDVDKQAGAYRKTYVCRRIRGGKKVPQTAAYGNKEDENVRQKDHETSSFS